MAIDNPHAGVGQPYTNDQHGTLYRPSIISYTTWPSRPSVAILNFVPIPDAQGIDGNLIGIHVTQPSLDAYFPKPVYIIAKDPHQRPMRLKVASWNVSGSQRWAVVEWSPGSTPPSNPVKAVMCMLYIP
jgi:hypothetical protein